MRIERFDPSVHDRSQCSTGISAVDNFFALTANKLQQAGNLRVFVLVEEEDGGIVGFYSLNAGSIDYRELPAKFARTRPGHGAIPVAFISMMGVSAKHQGKGFGGDLMANALTRISAAGDNLGLALVILDVLDCGNDNRIRRRRESYSGFGFKPLPTNPMRMYLPISSITPIA
jgi:GNAT superfamily N-acetyltransferase